MIVGSNRANGVLVHRLKLRVIFSLSLHIHLPEHVQGGFLSVVTNTRAAFRFHGSH